MAHLPLFLATIILIALVRAIPLPENTLLFGNDLDVIRDDPGVVYRLPSTVVPSAYKMLFIPDLSNFAFTGRSEITIDITGNDIRTIVLHAKKLNITSAVVIQNNTKISATPSIDNITDFLTLTLPSAIKPGNLVVQLEYKGELNEEFRGFYRSSYTDDDGKKVWLATTQFEPTYARYAFPCFDEPALKATFDISIKHSKNLKAISNMHEISRQTDETDITQVTTTFAKTPKMSTYLVAFVISDFESLSNEVFSIWARKNAIKNGHFALDIGKKELEELEKYTAIAHKDHGFKKMDSIAIPDFEAGAMENWGLVTYRESALLVEPNVTSTVLEQSVATVISHEFAHQWFGNLVSPKWWDFTWLNEGFAEYFQWVITDKVLPTWRLLDQQVIKSLQGTAFQIDSSASAHSMNHKVNSPDEIKAKFNGISYQKAGSVIRTVYHILGEKAFQAALQRYLKTMSFKAATPTDLFNEFSKSPAPSNFALILQNWANTPGFPVVTVVRNYTTGKATLTQERYLYKPDDAHKELYFVPINYATQDNKDFNVTTVTSWLNNVNQSTELDGKFKKNEWVIFNKQHFGYYRVNYDKENWRLITDFLKTANYKDIHVLNRAQLIDDVMNLARIGKCEYSTALKLVEYMKQEVDYAPWYTAFSSFSYLQRLLSNTGQYANFKNYILGLLDNLLKHVTYEESPQDQHVEKFLRADVIQWACTLGLKACRDDAFKKLTNWMNDSKTYKLSSDLKSTTLCAGVRSADAKTWNKLLEKVINEKESNLVIPLGCTSDKEILTNYLTNAINKNVKLADDTRTNIFSAVISGSEEGVNVALDFVIANKAKIIEVTGGTTKSIKTSIANIGLRITTKAQLDKFKKFINDDADLKNTSANALLNAEDNVKWITTHEQEFIEFFKKDTPDSGKGEPDSAVTFTVSTVLFLVSFSISQLY